MKAILIKIILLIFISNNVIGQIENNINPYSLTSPYIKSDFNLNDFREAPYNNSDIRPLKLILINSAAITFQAMGDAYRDMGWLEHNSQKSMYGHMLHTGMVFSFLTLSTEHFNRKEWIWETILYAGLRFAMYDFIYNKTRGLPFNYFGSSSKYDLFMKKHAPDGFIIGKTVIFSVTITIPFLKMNDFNYKKIGKVDRLISGY
jgi:hypothetical protein